MSKHKDDPANTERITNDDGSQLKVIASENKDGSKAIIVHCKDSEGNTTGHVTDPFNKPSVHVHDENGTRWEGGDSTNEDNSSSDTDDEDDGKSEGGCFITSAVCVTLNKDDDCLELKMFRHFRDTYMKETTEMQNEVIEYYYIAPKICSAINGLGQEFAMKEFSRIWEQSLKPAFFALKAKNFEKAYSIYKKMVLDLKSIYLSK